MTINAMTDTSPSATTPTGTSTSFTAVGDPRWRDAAWLDLWRQHGDPAGDACARALKEQGVPSVMTHRVIATMKANDRRVPDSAPAPLRKANAAQCEALFAHCEQRRRGRPAQPGNCF